jgi:hypothetical protein
MAALEQSLKRCDGESVLRVVVLAARTFGCEYENNRFTRANSSLK